MSRPNILFLMCDQLRWDAIAALGDKHVYTPNIDRLVRRGVTFTQAYSPCPVCMPARYCIRSGRETPATGCFSNTRMEGADIHARTGPYLAESLRALGYRTFGVGKFHAHPWNEDLGYDTHLISEEIYEHESQQGDAYLRFIRDNFPAYDHVEVLHGERGEMYYQPQTAALPKEITQEAWAAQEASRLIAEDDERPWFGFVSFVGPHPPLAPPTPYNRLYNPDAMPTPYRGDPAIDHADEQIPWMNHVIWANDMSDSQARLARARYYGEITHIDHCIGQVLAAVDRLPDPDNVLIAFFSDHGDHLGDHNAWQKESFFEASVKVPFLVSWPARLAAEQHSGQFVSLVDLYGLAQRAAGGNDLRDGVDLLASLEGSAPERDYLFSVYGEPGTHLFKIMVRSAGWKYIFLGNGGRELLFKTDEDPKELVDHAPSEAEVVQRHRAAAIEYLSRHELTQDALKDGTLFALPFERRPLVRVIQNNYWMNAPTFPAHPKDVLEPLYR